MVDENYLYCCWWSQKITSQDDGEEYSTEEGFISNIFPIYYG